LVIGLLAACGNDDVSESKISNNENVEVNENDDNESYADMLEELDEYEYTEKDRMIDEIVALFDDDLAFDTGSYSKGDIPKGEYAFVKFEGSGSYFSEVDGADNIIANENFDSFGYVQIHEAGNVEIDGVLINIEAFDTLEVTGAKEIFELINEIEEGYNESGQYKVGYDIDPGKYEIESYGSGYVGITDGPVGNGEIVNNDNFNGTYDVDIKDEQYLMLSKAYIVE